MSHHENPLAGRRVVVTRAAEQASELATRLEALGAEVLLLPLVQFAAASDPGPLDRALGELASFDWLLLTSQNTVRFLAQRAREIGLDLAAALGEGRPRPQVASVGRATEEAAREQGWRVDRASQGQGGAELVREWGDAWRGVRVLLPRSDRATADLPQALGEAGAHTVEVVAYRTLAVPTIDASVGDRLERGEADVVTFASPSAFSILQSYFGEERLRRLAGAARFAAIGPTTAAAIRRAGFAVSIEASVPSAAGLAAALAAYFSNPSVRPGRKS